MRIPSGRICVTLPLEMLEDYREKSRLTGLSVSRLIYRRLRSGKPIVIVSDNILTALDRVHEIISRMEKKGSADADFLYSLREYVAHADRIVDYNSPREVIHVRVREKKIKEVEKKEGAHRNDA